MSSIKSVDLISLKKCSSSNAIEVLKGLIYSTENEPYYPDKRLEDFEVDEMKIKNHPVLRAYTLLLMHRYNESNNFGHLSTGKIKVLEDSRSDLHLQAIKVLKENGIIGKKAKELLENEAERLINLKLPKLENDENYCGLCKEVIKTKDWKEHSNNQVHLFIGKEVMALRQMWNMVKYEKRNELEGGVVE